jgi:thioredoxin
MVQELNLEKFITQVFDFTKNKEWKFEGDLPCIIDFWAPWCGPCNALAPVFNELSEEYKGKVNFYKINTDEEQALASIFGIRSIPSLLFVPLNQAPRMAMGALPKSILIEAIEKELGIVSSSQESS